MIRNWAKTNQLFSSVLCRFNSYALALLVIHYLQSGVKPPVLPYLNKTHPQLFEYNASVNDISIDQDLNIRFGKIIFAPLTYPFLERKNKMSVLELLAGFMLYYKNFEFEKYRPSILEPTLQNR